MGTTSSGLPTVGEVPNDTTTNPFDSMGEDFDSLPDTLETTAEPAVKPAGQTQTEVPKPQVAAPVVKPPLAQPDASQTQPQAQPQAQPQQSDPSQEAQPADINAIIEKLGGDTGDILSSIVPAFALSQEQIIALEADAPAEVPKLLAQTYMRAVTTSLQYMRQIVPQMMQQMQNDQQVHQQAESEFFTKYPALNRDNHGNDIIAYAKAFSQTNPNLTREQLFSLVSSAVMAKNNLVGKQLQQTNRGQPVRQQAFSPASNSAPIISQTPIDENPFKGLGMEFE